MCILPFKLFGCFQITFLILYHCVWYFLNPYKIELYILLLRTRTADNVSHTGQLTVGRQGSRTEWEDGRVPSRMAQQVVEIQDYY